VYKRQRPTIRPVRVREVVRVMGMELKGFCWE